MSNNKTEDKIQLLNEWINNAKPESIVFFGGAGMSTESGIPDFRSQDGLYAQKYKYPPEMIISHSFFMQNTAEFYKFYLDKMIPPKDTKPNAAHNKLAEMEQHNKLNAVITQNIDGLHQAAGSKNVLELHGSILRNFCMTCHHPYNLEELLNASKNSEDGVPKCSHSGCCGIIKPDVVLYEEPLNNTIMQKSVQAISQADIMIVAGTSLAVYPAAGLLDYFNGSKLVIINRDPTPRDRMADLCIQGNVGEVFGAIKLEEN